MDIKLKQRKVTVIIDFLNCVCGNTDGCFTKFFCQLEEHKQKTSENETSRIGNIGLILYELLNIVTIDNIELFVVFKDKFLNKSNLIELVQKVFMTLHLGGNGILIDLLNKAYYINAHTDNKSADTDDRLITGIAIASSLDNIPVLILSDDRFEGGNYSHIKYDKVIKNKYTNKFVFVGTYISNEYTICANRLFNSSKIKVISPFTGKCLFEDKCCSFFTWMANNKEKKQNRKKSFT